MYHRQQCCDRDVSLGFEPVEPLNVPNIHIQMQSPVTQKHTRLFTVAYSDES